MSAEACIMGNGSATQHPLIKAGIRQPIHVRARWRQRARKSTMQYPCSGKPLAEDDVKPLGTVKASLHSLEIRTIDAGYTLT
eukprot:5740450-Pyramimonas_sp.AAC.1